VKFYANPIDKNQQFLNFLRVFDFSVLDFLHFLSRRPPQCCHRHPQPSLPQPLPRPAAVAVAVAVRVAVAVAVRVAVAAAAAVAVRVAVAVAVAVAAWHRAARPRSAGRRRRRPGSPGTKTDSKGARRKREPHFHAWVGFFLVKFG
jgi:hypothetical protein